MLTKLKLQYYKPFMNAEVHVKDRHLVLGTYNSCQTNLFSPLTLAGATARPHTPRAARAGPGLVSLLCEARLTGSLGVRLRFASASGQPQ